MLLIDWTFLAPALLLLLTPSALLQSKRLRARSLARDFSGQWGQALWLPHQAIDLLRAGVGAWLLAHSVARAPEATGTMKHAPIFLQLAVLALGTTLQTIVCRERDAFFAPFAYVLGLAAGFLPPLVATFALVIAVAVAMGSHLPTLFFVTLSASAAAFGLLLSGKKAILSLAPLCAAAFLPWILTLLCSRELVVMYRSRSTPEAPLRD